eukprot:14506023-Heterocapsa_arctica.AAC.1
MRMRGGYRSGCGWDASVRPGQTHRRGPAEEEHEIRLRGAQGALGAGRQGPPVGERERERERQKRFVN